MTARSLPGTAWARFKASVGRTLLNRVRPTLDNWRSALRLFPMLVLSWRHRPVDRRWEWWWYFVGQLGKETGRSLIPIVVLGVGFGLGVGSVTGGPGSLVGIAPVPRTVVELQPRSGHIGFEQSQDVPGVRIVQHKMPGS